MGPDSEPIAQLIRRRSGPSAAAALKALARAALALGCAGMLPRHFRVVRRLAEYGSFKAGGVLIGTHAFIAYGYMLGVRWRTHERTQDIDCADAGKALALALPTDVDVRPDSAMASLDMGLLPVSALGGRTGASDLIATEPDFRLDFLTPSHRQGDAPFVHPQLNVTLQPLPFMEFPLEGVEEAVLFCPQGAVLVNVPDASRFALLELLVYGERKAAFSARSSKDLAQAAHLLACLWEHQRERVLAAGADLLARGKGWVSRFRQGAQALRRAYPDLPACQALLNESAT